jgi:hypothetical protein
MVVGLAAGTMSVVEANSERFVTHSLLALGVDDSQTAPTPQDLLRRGIDDYRWGRYDEASEAFDQASKLPGLSEKQQEILAQYRALLVRVNKSRQEAGELLSSAKRALDQGDLKQAESLATTVASNGYASAEVRDEAKSILAKIAAPVRLPQGPVMALAVKPNSFSPRGASHSVKEIWMRPRPWLARPTQSRSRMESSRIRPANC